jgi:hypothetical protein
MTKTRRPPSTFAFKATYWLANAFIWNWLLLPLLPLAETLKVEVAVRREFSHAHVSAYYIVTLAWLVIAALCYPFWQG